MEIFPRLNTADGPGRSELDDRVRWKAFWHGFVKV